MGHDPKQFMREGRICDPADVKERTQALLDALQAKGVPVSVPDDYGLEPLAAAHAGHYLDYLATAYEQWQTLSSPGIEVLPSHARSEEHTSELQSLMRISYAVFC